MNTKQYFEAVPDSDTLEKLSDDPKLRPILNISGIIASTINKLADFDSELQQEITTIDQKRSTILKQIETLQKLIDTSSLQDISPDSMLMAIKAELEHKQKLVQVLQLMIEQILMENFIKIIIFVVEYLSDERLQIFNINRKSIIHTLYRNLAFYLDKFQISKQVIIDVEFEVKQHLFSTRHKEFEELIRPHQGLITDIQPGKISPDMNIPDNKKIKRETLQPIPDMFRNSAVEVKKGRTLPPGPNLFRNAMLENIYENQFKEFLRKTEVYSLRNPMTEVLTQEQSSQNANNTIDRLEQPNKSITPIPEKNDIKLDKPDNILVTEKVTVEKLGQNSNEQAGILSRMQKWFGKHKKGLLVALAVGMGGSGGLYLYKNSQSHLKQTNITNQTAKASLPMTPNHLSHIVVLQETEVHGNVQTTPEHKVNEKYVSVIKNSKNKVLQQMIHKGEYTLGKLSILDSMITPFKEIANTQQRAKITDFEQEINEGLVIYFYEKFGTATHKAESLKDPKLRNLWRTAKYVKLSDLKKVLSPQRYAAARKLGIQILEKDGKTFGYNVSANPALKAQTEGNMFQAHNPLSAIKIQTADGTLNVILQKMNRIFEGGLSANLSKKVPTQSQIIPILNNGNPNNLKSAPNSSGQILPDIAPIQDLNSINKLRMPSSNIPNTTDIDNDWDEKPISTIPNTTEIDNGWDEKPISTISNTTEIDNGWDDNNNDVDIKLSALMNQAEAYNKFMQTGEIKLDLDKRLTRFQEKHIVLNKVADELSVILGKSNYKYIEKVIKQFGFIGFQKLEFDGKGHVDVVLAPRVKAILLQAVKINNS